MTETSTVRGNPFAEIPELEAFHDQAVRSEPESATRSRPRRVLIVGINYAPEHSGIAPYTTGAAEYLAAQGDIVQVLTGIPHYPNWSVPDDVRRRLSWRENRGGVEICHLRHFVPASQSAVKRGLYELSYAAHVLASRHVWQPDVVLAVVPGLLSAVAASRIAKRTGARLVLWIQDSMAAAARQSGIAGGKTAARATALIENHVVRQADSIVVISESFRRHVLSAGASPGSVVLIRNWCHIDRPKADRQSTRARLGWGDEIVALHAGNMGLKQGLENIIAAAKQAAAGQTPTRFVLLGDGNQRPRLQHMASGLDNLDFLAPVSSHDFGDVLAAADVLLINEAESVVDMSLPSKLTSYLSAGRPVVAAASPAGETAREVERSGAGIVVPSGHPQLLLEAVVATGADPDVAADRGTRGRIYAESVLSQEFALRRLSDVLGS